MARTLRSTYALSKSQPRLVLRLVTVLRLMAAIRLGAPLLVLSMSASAQEPPVALKACRAEADDARRLRCYDREMDRAQPRPATVPATPAATSAAAAVVAPATPAATSAAAAVVAPATPAATSAVTTTVVTPAATPEATPPAPVSQPVPTRLPAFKAQITALSFRRAGELVATLDNGQVWTQYVAEGRVPIRVGDRVTIRPGWLGTYLLVGPSGWLTKVHMVSNAKP